jgi:hypothetical protein
MDWTDGLSLNVINHSIHSIHSIRSIHSIHFNQFILIQFNEPIYFISNLKFKFETQISLIQIVSNKSKSPNQWNNSIRSLHSFNVLIDQWFNSINSIQIQNSNSKFKSENRINPKQDWWTPWIRPSVKEGEGTAGWGG